MFDLSNALNIYFQEVLEQQWRDIVAALPPGVARRMKPPIFRLRSDISYWGSWDYLTRHMTINAALFIRHPWHALVDVLRHEIAHQITDEAMGKSGEPPHGRSFRMACELVNARPDASSDYPLLDQWLFQDEDDTPKSASENGQERCIQKIRKLLALAESADHHEAEAALLKAREIAARHTLELSAIIEANAGGENARDKQIATITIGPTYNRIPPDSSMLASILQDFYDVRCIWINVPEIGEKKYRNTLAISGTRHNLRVASYVYECIVNYIEREKLQLPSAMLGKVLSSKRALRDFRIGLLRGLRMALQAQILPPSDNALILREQQRLDNYLHRQYGHLKSTSSHRLMVNTEVHNAGMTAGRRFIAHNKLTRAPRELNP